MEFRYEIPDISDALSTADWVEFYLVVTSRDFSRAEFLDYLESTSGLDVDEFDQGQIDSVWLELERRESLYGNATPFNVDGPVIRYKHSDWKECPHYMMCLIFSLEGNGHVAGYTSTQSGQLFEKLVKIATEKFIQGPAYIYGYPNESLKSFADSIELVKHNKNPPSDIKDGGLDVLGLGLFMDGRMNALPIIIQCSAGRDWGEKVDDINVDEWMTWLDFPFRPTKGFASPIVMKDRDIEKKSKRMGLLIDRPRIIRTMRNDDIDPIRTDIEAWCESRLETLLQ